jgi:5,10-methylene-tetrahydrofolate dehydrogenase/methenyl tetrahydrofolate cyclohydrolase
MRLAVIQVGDVEASTREIRNKKKKCEEAGIEFEWYIFDEDISTEDLIFEIKALLPHVDELSISFFENKNQLQDCFCQTKSNH